MDLLKVISKALVKLISYTRIVLSLPLNMLIPLAIFSPVFIFADYFQKFYLGSEAIKYPIKYIIGFWAGSFPIAISVYLGHMKKIQIPEGKEKIFTSKISASIVSSSILIASIRIIPPIISSYGIKTSPEVISRTVLSLIYLLPATLVFIIYRNFTLFNDISSETRIKREFDENKEKIAKEYQEANSEEDFEELISKGALIERLIPDINWSFKKGEIKDALFNGNLMLVILGLGTYLIEKYFLEYGLGKLILTFIGLQLLVYCLIFVQGVITHLSTE